MPSSHPPTLVTLVKRALREAGIARGSRLLVAVSGGRDSVALLDVLARLTKSVGFELTAHGVDHGLREAAKDELALASEASKARGVPFEITHVRVTPGGNLQARARDARYCALEAAREAAGAKLIATGHHADDRAETFLLRLLRGAGPRGLYVLPMVSEHKFRPLIRASRADIDAHVKRHGIVYAEDPSNRAPRFQRSRVRHELLPLLRTFNPQIVSHLNDLSDQLGGITSHDSALPLPRATYDALRDLLSDENAITKKPEIWLPKGLVVRRERSHVRRDE